MYRLLLALMLYGSAQGWAALATPVAISSIAVAGSTVTVTTSAVHGLTAISGFCTTAPSSVCSAIATVPTTTTFTFAQPSTGNVAVCASSCGTVTQAPRAVVLDISQSVQGVQNVRFLLWLTTTSPIATSAATQWVAKTGSIGATTAQGNAVLAGNFVERVYTENFPATFTIGDIQNFISKTFASQQAALQATTQPAAFYGSVLDGVGWGQQ